MASRRESLKIIGAIGTTCAFPFSADELYGQHVHTIAPAPAADGPYTPQAFSASEFEVIGPVADGMIPATDTPGSGEKFFGLMKNLTADGYYTSQVGLVRELGYAGNTAMEKFPGCPEH